MIDKFAERGLRSLAVAYQVRRQWSFYLVLLFALLSPGPCTAVPGAFCRLHSSGRYV